MTQTKRAFEGDVVELLEDLPKYGVLRGQRGVIISEFDEPNEAYDLAIEDEDGEFVAFAYSVKPAQFKNIARDLFEEGINLINQGKMDEAETYLRKAIDLKPTFIGVLHNSLMHSFADSDDYGRLITGLKFVLRLNPTYKLAGVNLAVAFHKYGIQAEKQGDDALADTYFQMALFNSTEPDIVVSVQKSYSVIFTKWGISAFESDNLPKCYRFMHHAFLLAPTEQTKSNLGKSMAFLGFKLAEEKKDFEAISYFRAALEAGIEKPELFNDWGVSLCRLGRFEEAIDLFVRGLSIEPNHETILQNLNLAKSESKTIQYFTPEDVNLSFEPPLTFETGEYQVDQLLPQSQQYSLHLLAA